MDRRFSMLFVLGGAMALVVAVFSNSGRAQGGPSQAQLQSMRNANNATMNSGAAETSAGDAKGNAQALKAQLLPAFSGWDAPTQTWYNDTIALADASVRQGDVMMGIATNDDQANGNWNYGIAQGFWGQGNFAAAATYYDLSTGYYAQSVTDYGTAQLSYESAAAKYQQMLDYYNSHTPPIIRPVAPRERRLGEPVYRESL